MTSAITVAALVCVALVLALTGYVLAAHDPLRGASLARLRRAVLVRRRLLAMPIAAFVVLVACVLAWRSTDLTVLFQLRVLVLIAALFPLAVIDLKRHRVPNQILLGLLAVRGALYVVEALTDWERLRANVLAELVIAVVVLLFFLLIRMLHRGGMGMGDIKLFALVPLFLGPRLAVLAIFGSLVASFLVSLWLLLSRRSSRTDSFPLVPCILVGVTVVVGLTTWGVTS